MLKYFKNKKMQSVLTKHFVVVVSVNQKNLHTLNKNFWMPLNFVDNTSGNAGIFSKDITENLFKNIDGSNFQNLLFYNEGIYNTRLLYSTNFSFLQLNELFLKKDLYSKNTNPLFFLFWEGVPRREVTGLSIFISNLLYSFGGISCVLGSRSNLLWKSLFIGGGKFKKLSYISGRSSVIMSQRSNLYEGSRTFFSSNSENKGSYILNDFLSRLRVGGFFYDLHYSLAGLAFIANTDNFKNLKTRFFLNSCVAKNKQIKINNLILGNLSLRQSKNIKDIVKAKTITFLDSYKYSGSLLQNLNTDSINMISIPVEYESTAFVQNLQGSLIIAPKAITMRSQVIRSYSLISNILIESFFNKIQNSLWTTFNSQTGVGVNRFQGTFFELKNRFYGLLESKSYPLPLLNYKSQRFSSVYMFSETSADFVQLNICSVDGPSRHSRTMTELNWVLQLNNNFN